jgi:ferrochelatase
MSKLKQFYNFKPLFLDKNLNLVDFGKSDKFVLCQNSDSLVKKEFQFLEKKYKYAKILFITSHKLDFIKKNQLVLKNIEDLKSTLMLFI